MASIPVEDLIQDALFEIGAASVGSAVSAEDAAFVLGRLNQIADNWNGQREAVWAQKILRFTFIASQQDYTIGPDTADFAQDVRPVSIEWANTILSTDIRNGIRIRDFQWWMNLATPEITTTFPTDLYYAPDWPNGVLKFWPVPTNTDGLELSVRVTLDQLEINDAINMPPGYQAALMLTLAEDIAPAFGRVVNPKTERRALEARHRIYVNNAFTPRIATRDSGMPTFSGRNRSNFDYRTGSFIP